MSGKTLRRKMPQGGFFKRVCVCTRGFNSSQGLGSHQLSCETEEAQELKQEKEDAMVV